MRVRGIATTASRGMKRMVIMTVAAAGLIIGAGTAAVDPQEQGRIGQSEGQEVRALHVPYRAELRVFHG